MSKDNYQNSTAANAARMGQLAAGAANIIKGAVAGGIKGAAVAAAKSFAPQIIKLVFIILIALITLPMIIYSAIPSTLFQWDSSNGELAAEMTALADSANRLYSKTESLALDEANKLVAELSEGYDDVVVNMNLSGIGRNWLTAIDSVANQQKLDGVSENSLRTLILKNMDYSTETEEYDEDTGVPDENGDAIIETKQRIIISVYAVSPEEVMNELGFDDTQKQWTRFLYDNINDSQLISADNPDYPDYTKLINYGELVFSDGSCEVVYYNQTDARWGAEMYGSLQSIAIGGCGPTALAMAVSSLTETSTNPQEMAEWAYDNGHCVEGNGSYHSLIPEGAEHFGLTVTGAGVADAQKLIDALSDGKLVIAIMGPGHFTTLGHFIVLRGVTTEGKILVADPVSINRSGQEYALSIILNEARKGAVAGGPFWILGL